MEIVDYFEIQALRRTT